MGGVEGGGLKHGSEDGGGMRGGKGGGGEAWRGGA